MQDPQGRASKLARACIFAAGLVMMHLGGVHGVALADMINGFAELDYSQAKTTTKDVGGVTTSNNTSESITQKYNISLNLNPSPLLNITAGSLFELDNSTVKDINSKSHSTETILNPFFDCFLKNTLYQAGVGYNRREDTQTASQAPSATTFDEEYHAILAWKPEGFPDLAVRLTRTNIFDAQRSVQDSTTDLITLGSRYKYKSLDLTYQFTDTDSQDKLHDARSSSVTQNGAVSYSDQFFNKRTTLYTTYNITRRDATSKAGGAGQVDTPLFPVSGLSVFNNTPTAGAPDQNLPNPALIDGNLTASAGVNLGVVPLGGDLTKKWSIGADFFNVTEINTILIWVDRQLPPAIAGSFSWDVYIRSADTQDWTLWRTVSTAPFGPFQNSFRIAFDNVKTRFVKVVVSPLSQGVAALNPSFQNPGQISVTELQGFINQPAAQVQGMLSTTSQSFACDARTRLLGAPSLYHSLSFFLTSSAPGGQTSYVLANNLILDHKFNSIFSAGATAGREDSSLQSGHTTAYLYNATLRAAPLTGLSHVLVYSGRIEQSEKGSSDTNSVFLTTIAQVYSGIAFNASGGYSVSSDVAGLQTDSLVFNGGASVAPRKDLTFSLNYNRTKSTQSGGTASSSSNFSQNGTVNMAYRPFPNLYLFTSLGIISASNTQTQYIQNYGLNWSPFADGDLQFSFAYTENLTTVNNEKNTTIIPSISWKITRRATLDVSYPIITTDSAAGSTETTVFSTILRVSF